MHVESHNGEPSSRVGDRGLFPELRANAYLNHASCSPLSTAVTTAVNSMLGHVARTGAESMTSDVWPNIAASTRRSLAALVGARPQDVALTANTTAGIQAIAFGIPWCPGDQVLIFEQEFPGNVTPWHAAADLFALRVTRLPFDDIHTPNGPDLGRLERALRQGVRLVALSAVHFSSGRRLPLPEIAALCRRYDAELFVDAVQALGATPLGIAAEEIDYLACGGHKFLMGCMGAGFVYVNPERMPSLQPRLAGWRSHEDATGFLRPGGASVDARRMLLRSAGVFESGSPGVVAVAALQASVALIERLGVDVIFEHVNRYNDQLEAGLVERGFATMRPAQSAHRSAILSVHPPPQLDLASLAATLIAHEVAIGTPCDLLRFAPHWPNALDEIDVVLDVIDDALARARSEPRSMVGGAS